MVCVKRHHTAAEAKCISLLSRARRLLDPGDGSSQSSIVWLRGAMSFPSLCLFYSPPKSYVSSNSERK